MRRSSIAAATLLAALALGCSNQGRSGTSFNFSRPELIDFLCMARALDAKDAYVPVPRGCCGEIDPSRAADAPPLVANPEVCTRAGERMLAPSPVLHALVSQSARGELAAVDLKAEEVLDSNRVVPGSTFIDIGGLPTGLITPAQQPLSATPRGPIWTYVASAEELQVRAVANCRFREKVGCGPESIDSPSYITRTRVPLPAAPGDMVLAPVGTPEEALWVTLPELGLIARIELAADDAHPFAVGPGEVPLAPRFYRVPAPSTVEAPLPMAEPGEYAAVCGTGTDYVPAMRQQPLAPRVAASGALRPTRLRYDATSGLLLVSDAAAPVLHVFAPGADAALSSLGALPTGVPLRDFVLTPWVPARAPSKEQLYTPALPAVPDEGTERRRYLYGLEERGDGLIALFDFAMPAPNTLPTLTPLLAPAPEERYADRIRLPAPATALAVVDTRGRSAYVCGEQPDAELQAMIRAMRERAQVDPLELARLEERLDISEEADTEQLRGVFVTVASADGVLNIIDVQDLDLACRARDECAPSCPDLTSCAATDTPVNPEAQRAVAVRRHAPRRSSAGDVTATVSGSGRLLLPSSCAPERWPALTVTTAPAGANALVCVPKDPWSTVNEIWSVKHQGPLPGGGLNGALEFAGDFHPVDARVPAPGSGLVTLHAPVGANLCSRGLQVGDLVAITGTPAERAEGCTTPSPTSARLLEVREAFDDGVLLAVQPEEGEDAAFVLDELRRCYPDSVGFELRAGGYIVTGTSIYLHRVVTAPDGRCERDDSKDPRITSRPEAIGVPDAPEAGDPAFAPETDYRFENPYVSFTLARRGQRELRSARDLTVQVRNAAGPLTLANNDGRIRDALPVALRYLPEVGDLFVVDTASQGLRRYDFRPFAWDRNLYR